MKKMKQFLIMLVVAAAPMAANAGAGTRFDGTSDQAIMTVAEVGQLDNDKAVVMKGSIEKHARQDKYQFVDNAGRIVVEIDGAEWRGIHAAPNDTILMIGETNGDVTRGGTVNATIKKVVG